MSVAWPSFVADDDHAVGNSAAPEGVQGGMGTQARRGSRSGVGAAVVATVLLTLGLVPLLPAPPAWACSCMETSDAEAFERAVAVFTGTVVGYHPPPMTDTWSSTDLAVWVFSVHEVKKGTVNRPTQEVASAVSGASCGLEIPEEQGTYEVYADVPSGPEAPDGALTATLCGGTRVAADQPVPDEQVIPVENGQTGPWAENPGGVALAVGAGAALAGLAGLVLWRRRPGR